MSLQTLAAGRTDAYKIDPRIIQVEPNYNVRIEGPELVEANAQLKASIKAIGLGTPLRVRHGEGDTVILVQGHRRLSQIMELISEGHDIPTVMCLPEPKGVSVQDRVLDLLTSNSGHPLSMLEKAEIFKRLLGYGWSEEQIADKAGLTTKQFSNILSLGAAPQEIKEMVSSGQVSATTAIKTVQKEGGAKATTTLKAAAASNGGKKVTAGSLKKATAPTLAVSNPPEAWMPSFMAPNPVVRPLVKVDADKFRDMEAVMREILEVDDVQMIHAMIRECIEPSQKKSA